VRDELRAGSFSVQSEWRLESERRRLGRGRGRSWKNGGIFFIGDLVNHLRAADTIHRVHSYTTEEVSGLLQTETALGLTRVLLHAAPPAAATLYLWRSVRAGSRTGPPHARHAAPTTRIASVRSNGFASTS
jgi:hypothetical protein